MDGKRLVGEYWLDKKMLENIDDGSIIQLIKKHHPIETSTGYWSESVPETGKHNGKEYELVDKNIHPDHIALLTDEVGACSLKDGCGLNRNCQSCEVSQQKTENNFAVINGDLWQNVTGSLPKEGKKIYEAVYQQYKDKGLSDAEAAQRAWGAVKQAGWKQDKDGNWHKESTKKNQRENLDSLAEALFFAEVVSISKGE